MSEQAIESNKTAATASGLKIKVLGIGGAGINAVASLGLEDFPDVVVAGLNTDAQALAKSGLSETLLIGQSITRGLGAGGEVEIGRQVGEAEREAMARFIGEVDLLILVVGLGGGTGSAVAPIVAEVAARTNALVLAFASLPFSFERARRARIAEESIGELRKLVHGLMPLPNDVLLQEGDESTTVVNAFDVANRWIGRGVSSLCAMLLKTGLINQDFASLRSVFSERGGKTVFGNGFGSGDDCVKAALEDLFLCPLLHMGDRPSQLDRVLVNMIGGPDMGIGKVNQVMSQVAKQFNSREDLVLGAVIDENRRGTLEICLLGKAEMEVSVPIEKVFPKDRVNPLGETPGLGLEAEIATAGGSKRAVYSAKKGKKNDAVDQDEFDFIDLETQRGYFEKTERNEHKGEDLDVPTYLRKGVRIRLKIG